VAALKKQNSPDVGRRSLRSVPAVAPGWDAFYPVMVGAFKRCLAPKDIHHCLPLATRASRQAVNKSLGESDIIICTCRRSRCCMRCMSLLAAHFGSYARPPLMSAYGGVQRGRQIANALAGCVKDRVGDCRADCGNKTVARSVSSLRHWVKPKTSGANDPAVSLKG
jgi:hypothetical protein